MILDVNINKEQQRPSLISQDEYRSAIGHLASGVSVIAVNYEGENFGITASAVTSVSLEPPMLLVCVNKSTGTCHAINQTKSFSVNILNKDQGPLARQFAMTNYDKFANVDYTYDSFGNPYLTDSLVQLECKVFEAVSASTHMIFIAEVHHASLNTSEPLVYYRGKFGIFVQN